MKKNLLLFGIVLFAGMFAMQSCVIEGCTDSDATNYDSEANSDDGSCEYIYGCTDYNADNYESDAGMDDGSCIYSGDITFWISSDLGVGYIDVYFRGIYRGFISDYFSYGAPDCGESGAVTASYLWVSPGEYSWSAESRSGGYTWSGSIDIPTGYDCYTMELTLKKNGEAEAKFVPAGDGSAVAQPLAN
ncbi:MAG: hypothetical protein R6U85_05240 [Salinivirgaceae bacterium]